jgi:hypothetical protein
LQFQISVNGVRDGTAQRVTPLVIDIRPTGEVTGVIPAAGCKLSGLASQFVSPSAASLDVSLTGCQDPRFNVRFNGHLVSSTASKEAKLNLSAISMHLLLGKQQFATLEAVLKR